MINDMLGCVHTCPTVSGASQHAYACAARVTYHMLQYSVPKMLDLDLVAALDELQGHLDRVPRIATLQLQQSGQM